MPPTVRWYYDEMCDAIVVVTTTTTYMLLHMSRLNNLAEVPSIPAPTNLPKFLQPPLASPGLEFMLEVEPILKPKSLSEYLTLPELQPMSTDLPPLEPIVLEVPIIDISSSDSSTLAMDPHQASNTLQSDPSKETSIIASRVSWCSPGHVRASGHRRIYNLIIPYGHGRRWHGH